MYKLCHERNLCKGGENFEIWKYGCTNGDEPDWGDLQTTTAWSTTTKFDADSTPTSKPVITEPSFQIDVF